MKKKLLLTALVAVMAFALVGCSQENKAAYECPDDFQEVSIGDIATYVPDTWAIHESENIDSVVFMYPSNETYEEAESTLSIANFGEFDYEGDVDDALTQNIYDTNEQTGKYLTVLDMETNESGLDIKEYSSIGNNTVDHVCEFVYNGNLYMFDYHHPTDTNIDDPIPFMKIYAYPIN